jgi:hypothetical protein
MPSASPTPSPTAAGPTLTPAQLLNISTRVDVHTGDNLGIGGFIVRANASKKVIVRGLGPSLQSKAQPVTGRLADPIVELHDENAIIATNDNWKDSQQAEIEATGLAPKNEREAAIERTLAPGSYTAILRGKDNSTGIALIQAYDVDQQAGSDLANLSTRGLVETGNKVLIGGLITGNHTGDARIVIRALGPSLRNRLLNTLDDPTLEVHDQNGGVIAFNDNWKSSQRGQIEATALHRGAMPNRQSL